MQTQPSRKNLVLLAIIALLIAMIFMLVANPIPQDSAYHDFYDKRTLLATPHFWNVISNLPYAFVGVWGIYLLLKDKLTIIKALTPLYYLFCIGVFFVCFGSGYYHYAPNNETLFWDRLPMTIAFMSLFSIIIGEFVSIKVAKLLALPLLVFGIFSVYYWLITERSGEGDLRYYAIVQFLPILLIPYILLRYHSLYSKLSGYWWLLLCYVLAKVFEHFDKAIGSFFILSGHPIKHIISAVGVYLLLDSYRKRSQLRKLTSEE